MIIVGLILAFMAGAFSCHLYYKEEIERLNKLNKE